MINFTTSNTLKQGNTQSSNGMINFQLSDSLKNVQSVSAYDGSSDYYDNAAKYFGWTDEQKKLYSTRFDPSETVTWSENLEKTFKNYLSEKYSTTPTVNFLNYGGDFQQYDELIDTILKEGNKDGKYNDLIDQAREKIQSDYKIEDPLIKNIFVGEFTGDNKVAQEYDTYLSALKYYSTDNAQMTGWQKFTNLLTSTADQIVGGLAYGLESAFYAPYGAITGTSMTPPEGTFGSDLLTESEDITSQTLASMSNEADKFLWTTSQSIVNNIINYTLFGVKGVMTAMGLESGAMATKSAKDSGASDLQAYGVGLLEGAEEAFFERFSVGNLTKMEKAGLTGATLKQIAKNSLIQFGVEASEEMATELANIATEVFILKDKSDMVQLVSDYMDEHPEYGNKEAFWKALAEMTKQMGQAGLAGGISGGVMGGTTQTFNLARTSALAGGTQNAKAIISTQNVAKLTQTALKEMSKGSKISKSVSNEILSNIQNYNDAMQKAGHYDQTVDISKYQSEIKTSGALSENALKSIYNSTTDEKDFIKYYSDKKLKIAKANLEIDESLNAQAEALSKSVNTSNYDANNINEFNTAKGINTVYFYDAENSNINGFMKGNTMYLNTASTKNVYSTVAHEYLHFLKNTKLETYNRIKDAFVELSKSNESIKKSFEEVAGIYNVKGEALLDEQIARAMEDIMFDRSATSLKSGKQIKNVSQLMNFAEENQSVGKRLYNAFKEVYSRIKGKNFGNVETSLENLIKDLESVLKITETERKVQKLREKGKTEMLTPKENAFLAKNLNTPEVTTTNQEQFSLNSMFRAIGLRPVLQYVNGIKELVNIEDKQGNQVTKVTVDMIKNSPLAHMLEKMAQVMSKKGEDRTKFVQDRLTFFADFANLMLKYKDVQQTYELVGASMFTCVKKNSDTQYGYSIDFASICKKTEAIMEVMSKEMLRLGRGLTKEEILDKYREEAGLGNLVPCPYCYVFARWLGMGSTLNRINTYQNQYANASFEEIRKDLYEFYRLVKEQLAKTKDSKATFGGVKATITQKYASIVDDINMIRDSENATNKTIKEEEIKELLEENDIEAVKKKDGTYDTSIVQKRYDILSAGSWLETVRTKTVVDKKTHTILEVKNNPDYEAVPAEVLFDLSRTGEFASHPKWGLTWKWKKSLGVSQGKAISPYADTRLGDISSGIASPEDVFNSEPSYPVQNKRKSFFDEDGNITADGQKKIDSAIRKIKIQNLLGGNRIQSWSDFKESFITDFMLSFVELEGLGAMVQGYTKVIEGVDFLAQVGACMNLSLSSAGVGYEIKDGKLILKFSNLTGINILGAIEMMKKYRQIGTILIGTSLDQIKFTLGSKEIRMVIPFHASGNTEDNITAMMQELDKEYKKGMHTDFSKVQTDKVVDEEMLKKGVYTKYITENKVRRRFTFDLTGYNLETAKVNRDVRERLLTGKFTSQDMAVVNQSKYLKNIYNMLYTKGEYKGVFLSKKQASQIYPFEFWDTTSTYETSGVNTDRFFEYCKELGMIPRFFMIEQLNHDFYWKTLVDRNMYDYTTGEYVEQPKISLDNLINDMNKVVPMKDGKKISLAQATGTTKITQEEYARKKDFAPVEIEVGDIQQSLDEVSPVKPSSNEWKRTWTTQEVADAYPKFRNVKVKDESGKRHSTQIAATVATYNKIYDELKLEGFKGTILDASSGLGLGTKSGKENYGFNVEDVEPFPDKEKYHPKYEDYADIKKKYDVIISNAVLNVIPQDERDNLVVKMGNLLKDGGRMFISTRGSDVEQLAKKNPKLGEMEYFVKSTGAYQKGFTTSELTAYLQDALGKNYSIKPVSWFGQTSVIVTKGTKQDVKFSQDSDGNELTKEQSRFFRNSYVTDHGKLMPMYHMTNAEFTKFQKKYIGATGRMHGAGFNFSRYPRSEYGKNQMKVYLNIENPITSIRKTISKEQLKNTIREYDREVSPKHYGDTVVSEWLGDQATFGSEKYEKLLNRVASEIHSYAMADLDIYSSFSNVAPDNEATMEAFKKLGFDGVIEFTQDGEVPSVAVTFEPNQSKSVTNLTPTLDDDINFSQDAYDSLMDDKLFREMFSDVSEEELLKLLTEDIKFDQEEEYRLEREKHQETRLLKTQQQVKQDIIKSMYDNGTLNKVINKLVDKHPQMKSFFKDSAITEKNLDDSRRSKSNDLVVMFHGTSDTFNTFMGKKLQTSYYGKGFYFTKNFNEALRYGENVKATLLNIKNPMKMNQDVVTDAQWKQFIKKVTTRYSLDFLAQYKETGNETYDELIDKAIKDIGSRSDYYALEHLFENSNVSFEEFYGAFADITGFDGIIVPHKGWAIAYRRNQIKDILNFTPTEDEDIRYSKDFDSAGEKLTAQQVKKFGDSKFVDRHGRLLRLYHGSDHAGFMQFYDEYPIFLTDSFARATTYSFGDSLMVTKKFNTMNELLNYLETDGKDEINYGDIEYGIDRVKNVKGAVDGVYKRIEKLKEIKASEILINNYEKIVTKNKYIIYIIDQNGEMSFDIIQDDADPNDVLEQLQTTLNEVASSDRVDVYSDNFEYDMAEDYEDEDIIPDYYGANTVYALYGDSKNPLVIDCKGHNFLTIPYKGGYFSTDDIARMVKDEGIYDGIIFKNIMDNGARDSYNEMGLGNVYVVFKSSQVKATDNVAPTEHPDIRYSKDKVKMPKTSVLEAEKLISQYSRKKVFTLKESTKGLNAIMDENPISKGFTKYLPKSGKQDMASILAVYANKLGSPKTQGDLDKVSAFASDFAEELVDRAYAKYLIASNGVYDSDMFDDAEVEKLQKEYATKVQAYITEGGERSKYAQWIKNIIDTVGEKQAVLVANRKLDSIFISVYNTSKGLTKRGRVLKAKEMLAPFAEDVASFISDIQNSSDRDYSRGRTRNALKRSFYSWDNEVLTMGRKFDSKEAFETELRQLGKIGLFDAETYFAFQSIANGTGRVTSHELAILADIMKSMGRLIYTYDVGYLGEKISITDTTKSTIETINNYKRPNKMVGYISAFVDPMTVMRELDEYNENGFFTRAFKAIQDAETASGKTTYDLINPAITFFKARKGYRKHFFKDTITINEKQVPINIALSLYMTAQQRTGMASLEKSGFNYRKGNKIIEVGTVTEEDINNIYEQFDVQDKEFLRVARTMFDECTKLKEETDIKKRGVADVVRDNYFPILRGNSAFDGGTLANKGYQSWIDASSSQGWQQHRVYSTSKLTMVNIFDLMRKHASEMSAYYNMSIPAETFSQILYNDVIIQDGDTQTRTNIMEVLRNKLGWSKANGYIKDLMLDIQGISRRETSHYMSTKLFERFRSAFATYQLGLNLTVVVSQMASYPTAFADLSFGSLAKAFKSGYGKADYAEMDKYCDYVMVRNAENGVAKAESVLDKTDEIANKTTYFIGKTDRLTIHRIWVACQYEVEKTQGLAYGTEENKVQAGKLLEKVTRDTQPNYVTSERSAFMRHPNQLVKLFTMFQSVQLKQLSRIVESSREVVWARRTGDQDKIRSASKHLAKSATAVLSANLVYVLFKMLCKELLKKRDEDKTFGEEFGMDFLATSVGILPIIKDIYGLVVQDYDISVYPVEMLESIVSSVKTVGEITIKGIKGEAMDKSTIAKAMKDLTESVCQLLGIPSRNVYNLIYGVIADFDPSTAYKIEDLFYSVNYKEDAQKAIEDGDSDLAKTIIEAGLKHYGIDNATSKEINEIYKLTKKGYDVYPSGLSLYYTKDGTTVYYSKDTYNKMVTYYSKSSKVANELVSSDAYKNLEDEQKESALNYVFDSYKLYAQYKVGTDVNNEFKALMPTLIDMTKFATIYGYKSTLKSTDDATIKEQLTAYMSRMSLTSTEKIFIYAYYGYKLTDSQKSTLKNYINGLSLSDDEKTLVINKLIK